jgi:diguanylate cyclase (GGDEF)-like protein
VAPALGSAMKRGPPAEVDVDVAQVPTSHRASCAVRARLKASSVAADLTRVMRELPLRLSRDERELAGRLGGALWLMALPAVGLALATPGIPGQWPTVALALAAAATAWGVIAVFVVRWGECGPVPYHALAAISVVVIASLVATTGAARSPLWPLFFLVVAYCSYFYPRTQAIPYVAACMAGQLLPLSYDSGAVSGELVVAAFCYPAVGAVVMLGKRQLATLRDTAEYLALHDPLTGLPNRRPLLARLEREIEKGTATVALFLVDLDDFKTANSLHGHQAGDMALRRAGAALLRAVRAEDTVARLGGDEFAVLACRLDDGALALLSQRLIASVARSGEALGLPGFRLGASVGWARFPIDARTAEELITAADLSLAAAKAHGKGTSRSPLDLQASHGADRRSRARTAVPHSPDVLRGTSGTLDGDGTCTQTKG